MNTISIIRNKTISKIDWIIPLLMSVLYLLAFKGVLYNFVYSTLAIVFGLYFFPFKLLITNNNDKNKLLQVVSNVICSFILSLTAIYIYSMPMDGFIRNSIIIIGLLNTVFFFYVYLKSKDKQMFLVHFCFSFLIAFSLDYIV